MCILIYIIPVVLITIYIAGISHYKDPDFYSRDRLSQIMNVLNFSSFGSSKLKDEGKFILESDQYFWHSLKWPLYYLQDRKRAFLKWTGMMKEGYSKFRGESL
jgi:hypothetical protein